MPKDSVLFWLSKAAFQEKSVQSQTIAQSLKQKTTLNEDDQPF
jgi:hypothetical protein